MRTSDKGFIYICTLPTNDKHHKNRHKGLNTTLKN